MLETCQILLKFFEQNGMKTAQQAFKSEMPNLLRSADNLHYKNDDLINNLKQFMKENPQANGSDNNVQNKAPKARSQNDIKNRNVYSQQETEVIMEKLMNKLVSTNKLLEDEKTDINVQKISQSKAFKKLIKKGDDVIEDVVDSPRQNLKQQDDTQNKSMQDPNYIPISQSRQFKQDIEAQKVNKFQQEIAIPGEDVLFMTEETPNQSISQNSNLQIYSKKPGSMRGERKEQDILGKQNQMPSFIKPKQNDVSDFFQNSQSINILEQLEEPNFTDEYTDDDDPGFDLYEVPEREFQKIADQLALKCDFPNRATSQAKKKHVDYKNMFLQNNDEDDESQMLQNQQRNANNNNNPGQNQGNESTEQNISNVDQDLLSRRSNNQARGYIYLPKFLKHPPSNDEFYPVQLDKAIYDCFDLKIITDRERTGFEETKEFPIVINSIVAGRYQIMEYLGSAAFSKAIQCQDKQTGQMLCMKIIENNKDYFDQSIDEIKLLKYINYNGDVDEKNVLKVYDYFYHKEHLFIVTELLKDNLYEFYRFNRENETQPYFTLGRLQKITQQILIGLDYIHSLRLIHCDLKPENILMKSYSKCQVKIIDFGSSCFIHDHLSSYVQSRSYRAPEVILGCKYDYKIDMWSLGCILAELWTGNVLFQNDTVQGLLARVIGIIGPIPEWMFQEGRLVNNFFTNKRLLYQDVFEEGEPSQNINDTSDMPGRRQKSGKIQILVPKKSNLRARLKTDDLMFLDFVKSLLQIDRTRRPSAKEALQHPWLTQSHYQEDQ
ncbi:hypothetical protein ABPG74_012057 [Tetrahymena malaccensis]